MKAIDWETLWLCLYHCVWNCMEVHVLQNVAVHVWMREDGTVNASVWHYGTLCVYVRVSGRLWQCKCVAVRVAVCVVVSMCSSGAWCGGVSNGVVWQCVQRCGGVCVCVTVRLHMCEHVRSEWQ